MSFNNKVEKFFERKKKQIADKQQSIVADALSTLFLNSPHAGIGTSKGEYDANHKIRINAGPVSAHNSATGGVSGSFAHIQSEIGKTLGIECGDDVDIINTTDHARDVEYGAPFAPTWKKDGYHCFEKTKLILKQRHNDVIK